MKKLLLCLILLITTNLYAQVSYKSYTDKFECQSIHLGEIEEITLIVRRNFLTEVGMINGQKLKKDFIGTERIMNNFFKDSSITDRYDIDKKALDFMTQDHVVSYNYTAKESGTIYSLSHGMYYRPRTGSGTNYYLVIAQQEEYSFYKCYLTSPSNNN